MKMAIKAIEITATIATLRIMMFRVLPREEGYETISQSLHEPSRGKRKSLYSFPRYELPTERGYLPNANFIRRVDGAVGCALR